MQILDISTALFAIWELACAVSPNITSLLIFRIFSGLGGSACLSIGGGIVSDLFDSNERGVATAVFALGPLLGPVIGPIVGGFLSQEAGWRWVIALNFRLGRTSLTDRCRCSGFCSSSDFLHSCFKYLRVGRPTCESSWQENVPLKADLVGGGIVWIGMAQSSSHMQTATETSV